MCRKNFIAPVFTIVIPLSFGSSTKAIRIEPLNDSTSISSPVHCGPTPSPTKLPRRVLEATLPEPSSETALLGGGRNWSDARRGRGGGVCSEDPPALDRDVRGSDGADDMFRWSMSSKEASSSLGLVGGDKDAWTLCQSPINPFPQPFAVENVANAAFTAGEKYVSPFDDR